MGEKKQDGAVRSGRRRWFGAVLDLTLGRLLKWAAIAGLLALVVGLVAFAVFVYWPVHTIPAAEPIDEYVYLDQGWGQALTAEHRQTYYYTPQGTSIPQGALLAPLRYVWFVNLEMPFSRARFAAPEHMRRYRFLVDPQPTGRNPDQLPVGFTRHFDDAIGEEVLDITCAACHSGEIHTQEKSGRRIAIRIDGGQAMHAFTDMQRGAFVPTLVASLVETYVNPVKFNRFARQVIGARYPQGKGALRGALFATIRALASEGQNNPLRHLYPVREGFGRTDALGRIANTTFGDHLVPGNYHAALAPVSYPYLWNIWKFDWVQYNGSVRQPLARNIGEALGVGAVIRMHDTYGNHLPPAARYSSSVLIPNLITIEHTLQRLTPPHWPADLLGTPDAALAERGRLLFEQRCVMCHGPHPASPALQQASAPGKSAPGEVWTIEVVPLAHIGTDPTAATAFIENRYDLSKTGLSAAEIASVLKPLLVRDLARDTRYRLREVVDARRAANLDLGQLSALLDAYPDPDTSATAELPASSFAAIARELEALAIDTQAHAIEPPAVGYECTLECQTAWLSFDVHGAAAAIDRRMAALDVTKMTEGEGLNVLGLLIKRRFYADNRIDYATQQCLEGFGALDLPQQIAGYKPRPLEGVWATPPFLHNGSVPSIYQMLLPPEQRSARFFVGRRDYDPKHLGYIATPADPDEADGFWLDTTIVGNHNSGHAFAADPAQWQAHHDDPAAHPLPPGVIGPLLADEERYAILEYLKVHRDLPATPPDFAPPDCGPWGAPQ